MVASATTLIYGSSVLLDITAISLNAAYVNLSSDAVYTAYIYGGDLEAGLTTQLYSQYSADTLPPCQVLLCDGSLLPEKPVPACVAHCLPLAWNQKIWCLQLVCLKACVRHLAGTVHAADPMHIALCINWCLACAALDGNNTAVGSYELNTTDLCGCAGGTFVISAVFTDQSEFFGDSTGTVTIVVQPNCPPVRPCAPLPLLTAHLHGAQRASSLPATALSSGWRPRTPSSPFPWNNAPSLPALDQHGT